MGHGGSQGLGRRGVPDVSGLCNIAEYSALLIWRGVETKEERIRHRSQIYMT